MSPQSGSKRWQLPLAAEAGSRAGCAHLLKTKTSPNKSQLAYDTYELGMSMDPPKRHDRLLYLRFEQLNFVNHRALVLRSSLLGKDERGNVELTCTFFTRKDRACFYLASCVVVTLLQKLCDDLEWAYHRLQ